MDEALHDELARICAAVHILSPAELSFAGHALAAYADGSDSSAPEPMVALLSEQLYRHCYTHRFDGTLHEGPSELPPEGDLSAALSAANPSRPRWDPDWQIAQLLPSGQLLVEKHGRARVLWPGEFLNHDGPGLAPQPGQRVSVYQPREATALQPGFYFAFGETISDYLEEGAWLRFYWSVRADGAPRLLQRLAETLNDFQLPFRFKCLMHRALYERCDAAVLYLHRRFAHLALELLPGVHTRLRDELRDETPLFTLRLASGLALAEDPGTAESFGMHRCRLLAEGLWSAYVEGRQDTPARLERIARQFARHGLDLNRPYLNAGSHAVYLLAAE